MKSFIVYLFRAPECKRGWLSYVGHEHARDATLHVVLEAETAKKAKNTAITLANQDFADLVITKKNFDHRCFGIKNFPELLEKFARPSCSKCYGKGRYEYYHDAGDHFGAGTAPNSEWRTRICDCVK